MNMNRPRFLHEPPTAESGFDTAQVCINGHEVNASTRLSPEFNEKFCSTCGSETITACPTCKAPIRGHVRGSLATSYTPPKFCSGCGKAFPWTASTLHAARMYADELSDLTPEERQLLKGALDDLVKDTPATPLAAARFKKLLQKAGAGVLEAMRKLVIDIVSDTAKKAITGQ
jgi:hypothetical protein